ncbi:hypothetical protein V8E53_013593 [Lactarius tabidus]
MLEIDWDSEDDRRRRRRKASTIHGWLCMWRGTLIGNERVRQRGRREMKEARNARAHYRQRAQEGAGGGGGGGLTVPNTTTTIIVEIPHKNALRPSNVRAAADLPRRRGTRSPCGRIVRTPPRAGQVPRDALRHRGVDSPAILYGRARGFHEDYLSIPFRSYASAPFVFGVSWPIC